MMMIQELFAEVMPGRLCQILHLYLHRRIRRQMNQLLVLQLQMMFMAVAEGEEQDLMPPYTSQTV